MHQITLERLELRMSVGSTNVPSAHTGGLTTGAAGSASDLGTDADVMDALNDVTFQKIQI